MMRMTPSSQSPRMPEQALLLLWGAYGARRRGHTERGNPAEGQHVGGGSGSGADGGGRGQSAEGHARYVAFRNLRAE